MTCGDESSTQEPSLCALFIGAPDELAREVAWQIVPNAAEAVQRLRDEPSWGTGIALVVMDGGSWTSPDALELVDFLPSPVRVQVVEGAQPAKATSGDYDLEIGREALASPEAFAGLAAGHRRWRGHWVREKLPWLIVRPRTRWVVVAGSGCASVLGGRMPVGDLTRFLELPEEAWLEDSWRGAVRAWNQELVYVTIERLVDLSLFVTLSSDVRVGAQLSRQLQQVLLSQIAVMLAHEVATPLSAVKTTLAVSMNNVERWPLLRVAESLRGALGEIRRLERMVRSYLSLGRGRAEPDQAATLAGLVRSTAADMQGYLDDLGIDLCVDPIPEVYRVRFGRDEFRQVAWNLVKNAADAVLEAGVDAPRIRITVQPAGGHVVLGFDDNGPGIDEEAAEQLFMPFVTSKPHGGTGIGLALSRLIARRFGASLTVSPLVGGGTRAALHLPLDDARSP